MAAEPRPAESMAEQSRKSEALQRKRGGRRRRRSRKGRSIDRVRAEPSDSRPEDETEPNVDDDEACIGLGVSNETTKLETKIDEEETCSTDERTQQDRQDPVRRTRNSTGEPGGVETPSTSSGASCGDWSAESVADKVPRAGEKGVPMSSFARSLDAFRDPIHAALKDVADECLHTLHVQSEKHVPREAATSGQLDKAYVGMTGLPRSDMLTWLFRALGGYMLPDRILFLTMGHLDRYYAFASATSTFSSEEAARAQPRLIAAVTLSLKTEGNSDGDVHGRAILHGLCTGTVNPTDVLRTELDLLTRLNFDVTVPTPFDFLEALGARLLLCGCPSSVISFANMLLHFALGNASLYYSFPHAILVGASLCRALLSVQASNDMHQTVMEDLTFFLCSAHSKGSIDKSRLPSLIDQCDGGIRDEWSKVVSEEPSTYAYFVRSRFDHVAC